MKSYLLLFFSTLLLLFTLSQPDRSLNSYACAAKSELTEADNSDKRSAKSTCARKCQKHQIHSRQQNAANVTTDCSQQFYAVVADTQQEEQHASFTASQQITPAAAGKHQSPHLETDPDPPRLP
jgi:hypothetical protein